MQRDPDEHTCVETGLLDRLQVGIDAQVDRGIERVLQPDPEAEVGVRAVDERAVAIVAAWNVGAPAAVPERECDGRLATEADPSR